jgi:pimeloyl-ACP methyl ester carboxylesterase
VPRRADARGDAALRVCLEREVELGASSLRLLDWPGRRGPLVVVADPFAPTEAAALAGRIAEAFAPRYRVLHVAPRPAAPYQVHVEDTRGVLQQFGFVRPVLVSSGLGAVVVLLLAAWYPALVGALVLIDPTYAPPMDATLAARALRECPPDWAAVRRGVHCRELVLESATPDLLERLGAFCGGA